MPAVKQTTQVCFALCSEQQVLEREHALLRQEQQVHAEQGRLTQLQSELQSQYTCLMTSLPLLQKRSAGLQHVLRDLKTIPAW